MLSEYLKSGTREIHESTEEQSDARFIMDCSITMAQYVAMVTNYYQVYRGLELEIGSVITHVDHGINKYLTNEKSTLLYKDLREMLDSKALAQVVPINFEVGSYPQAVGMMYVMEGSMLGNSMISKKIGDCDALAAINRFHFFDPNRKMDVMRWKSFKQALDSIVFTESEHEECLDGATYAFKSFGA